MLIKQLPNPANDLNRLVIYLEPSDEEIPLTGGAGRIFNNLLRSAGIKRDGLTVLGCRGTYSSIHYSNLLRDDIVPFINSRAWSRIDLIGEKALKFVGDKRGGIAKWRGSPLDIHGQRGMATYDPLYLMRDQEMLPVAANDLTKSLIEPPENYKPFPSIEDVRNFRATTFAFDIECPKYKTMGDAAPPEMVGLCAESGVAMCVPIRGEYTSELRRIFTNAENLIGHNCIQFDVPKLFPVLCIEWKPE